MKKREGEEMCETWFGAQMKRMHIKSTGLGLCHKMEDAQGEEIVREKRVRTGPGHIFR